MFMSENLILLPLDRLPNSHIERHTALRNYFCDKDAKVTRTCDGWHLILEWSNDDARYVDPRLREGLDWWKPNFLYSGMAVAKRRKGRILHTLYDTWTLLSWSEWLVTQKASYSSSVVILHIDDHRDIGSPTIFIKNKIWLDPITNKYVDLKSPNSVSSAICSGAIGIGSFITPFLHKLPKAEVRHLCQPPKAIKTLDFIISRVVEADTLLDLAAKRPAIKLIPASDFMGLGGYYRLTPNIGDWLDGIGNRPVLLHIDMDYFSNRYDGDSDWSEKPAHLNSSLDAVFSKIDELTDALYRANIAKQIEDIVIAYSPGFFPAEFWAAASDRLTTKLNILLG